MIFEIIFTKQTLHFSEDFIDVDGSLNGRSPQVTGIVPKDRADALCLFEEMQNKRFVCIFTDRNERLKVLGSKLTPAIFRFTRDNKTIANDRNEYVLTLTGPNRKTVPFLANENITFEPFAENLVYQTREIINTQRRSNVVAQFMGR